MKDSTASPEPLRGVYPFGSIYLTYIPLNDMTNLLNEPKKFAQLASTAASGHALQILKTFLNDERQAHMNEALAFVQINLKTGKAGFKKISDRNGTISEMAWDKSTVREIGRFSDEFLKRLVECENVQTSIANGRATVRKAWEDLQSLTQDPFIPTLRTMRLGRDFKSLLESKREEFASLKFEKHSTYTAIQDFSTKYDSSLAALKQEETFKPIQIMIDQALVTQERFSEAYTHCLLQAQDFLDVSNSSKKRSARLLTELGYLDAIKSSEQGFVELYHAVSATEAASVVSRHLEQAFFALQVVSKPSKKV